MLRRRLQIELKTLDQFALMREAGLVVAAGLAAMREAVAPGVSTAELDAIARDVLATHGATSSFLNYGNPPFPAVICSSVNAEVVHAIPTEDAVLREGDLISLDFGAIVDGWHGDAAITVPVGAVSAEAAALSAACEKALWDGLAAARVGGRLTDISHAVQTSAQGSTSAQAAEQRSGPASGQASAQAAGHGHVSGHTAGGFGIVAGYGGHGIGSQMHMDPHVSNLGHPGRGPHLVAGMALAVEPMLTLGAAATRELPDQWTVVTADGSLAAHWEHTVAILDDGPWVLTAPDGGRAELAARGITLSTAA